MVQEKHTFAHSFRIHKPAVVPRLRIPNIGSFHHHIKERRVSSKATVFLTQLGQARDLKEKGKKNLTENLAGLPNE